MRRRAVLVGLLLASIVVAWSCVAQRRPRHDERAHLEQLTSFARGKWRLYTRPDEAFPYLAMLPGYHVVVGLLVRATGWWGLDGARLLSLLLATAILPISVRLARCASIDDPLSRACGVFWFPLLFPFEFLVYTEALSNVLCLAVLLLAWNRRTTFAGMCGAAAIAVRQSNVVWVAAVAASAIVRAFLTDGRPPALRNLATTYWSFLTAVAGFGAFVAYNGRVPLNDPAYYTRTVTTQNLFFSLVLGALLFAPWIIGRLPAVVTYFRRRVGTVVAVGCAIAALGAAFAVTDYRNDVTESPQLLRNYGVAMITGGIWGRLAACAAATWFTLTLLAEDWPPETALLLGAAWLPGLLPLEFVEPRYYITFYSLIVLLRRPRGRLGAAACNIYWLVAGYALLRIAMYTTYFP